MKKNNYKRLGDYIREVDVRNKDLKITNLLGVSISKEFIPSIANTIGTNMSTYKVVRNNQFVYIADTSRRGDKIAIALLKTEEAIVSSIYTVFELKDINHLLPEYLMMWFKRPEFDRYARYKSHGSAREIFDWEEMCNVYLPVPPIEEQRKIVSDYETLTFRIKLNEQMIQKLEDTAQTIYRKMFVDDIDPEDLPEGWRMGNFGEISIISSGKTCIDKRQFPTLDYLYPVAGASGVIGYSSIYNQNEKLLTTGRVGTLGVVNRYNTYLYAADNVLVIKSKYYEYCYQILRSLDYSEIAKGGVQSLITQTDLNNVSILIPSHKPLSIFENENSVIYKHIDNILAENTRLLDLQFLSLTKMGL